MLCLPMIKDDSMGASQNIKHLFEKNFLNASWRSLNNESLWIFESSGTYCYM